MKRFAKVASFFLFQWSCIFHFYRLKSEILWIFKIEFLKKVPPASHVAIVSYCMRGISYVLKDAFSMANNDNKNFKSGEHFRAPHRILVSLGVWGQKFVNMARFWLLSEFLHVKLQRAQQCARIIWIHLTILSYQPVGLKPQHKWKAEKTAEWNWF